MQNGSFGIKGGQTGPPVQCQSAIVEHFQHVSEEGKTPQM